MSRLGEEFQRIGGPGAVTWWAFGVSLFDRTLTAFTLPYNAGASVSARLLASVLAELAMFAPLVLLRLTLLKDPLRPRPWVALAGFVVADVVRALVLDQLLHAFTGIPLMPALRVFSGFLPTLLPLIAVAYFVNCFRERRRDLEWLMSAHEQLELSRREAEEAMRFRNNELVARVRAVMEGQLAGISGKQPAEVVAQLQRTASDVIRPLSHDLARSLSAREGPQPEPVRVQLGWRHVVGELTVSRPFLPLATVAFISGVLLSTAATVPEVRWQFLSMMIIIPVVLAGANAILLPVLPRLRPIARLSLIIGAGAGSALVISLLLWATIRGWKGSVDFATAAFFYMAVVSVAMAFTHGMLAARTELLTDTATASERLRRQVVRTRQSTWFQQRMVARALHGPMQTAVTAAAIRLEWAIRTDAAAVGVADQIRAELLTTLDVLDESSDSVVTLDEGLERLRSTWEGTCVIYDDVSPSAAQVMAADGVSRSIVIDIMSEAVSNAVWHGHATVSTIRIDVGGDDLDELVVEVIANSWGIEQPKRQGLGTQLLDECTLRWRRETTVAGDCLTAILPC